MSEPLNIFDPRRNMHVQGFSGRAATTTIHDATAAGISISGIFQGAEDFAVLGFHNAYDCIQSPLREARAAHGSFRVRATTKKTAS